MLLILGNLSNYTLFYSFIRRPRLLFKGLQIPAHTPQSPFHNSITLQHQIYSLKFLADFSRAENNYFLYTNSYRVEMNGKGGEEKCVRLAIQFSSKKQNSGADTVDQGVFSLSGSSTVS